VGYAFEWGDIFLNSFLWSCAVNYLNFKIIISNWAGGCYDCENTGWDTKTTDFQSSIIKFEKNEWKLIINLL